MVHLFVKLLLHILWVICSQHMYQLICVVYRQAKLLRSFSPLLTCCSSPGWPAGSQVRQSTIRFTGGIRMLLLPIATVCWGHDVWFGQDFSHWPVHMPLLLTQCQHHNVTMTLVCGSLLKIKIGSWLAIRNIITEYHWLPHWKYTVNLSYQIGICSVTWWNESENDQSLTIIWALWMNIGCTPIRAQMVIVTFGRSFELNTL